MSLASKLARKAREAGLARLSADQLRARLAGRRGVLFLCYHSVSEDLPDYPYRTAPAAFDAQLSFLREVFDVLPSAGAVAALRDGGLSARARPAAVLCFDDGFRDNLAVATPILERHGLPASLFAPRDLIRRGGTTHLDEAGLRDLARHPLWTVGAHGVTHNVLTGFLPTDVRREMTECRDWLSDLLGEAPAGFAYPQGAIGADVVAAARETYDHAFSTDRRLDAAFNAWTVRRHCPTADEDDLAAFARALVTAPMEDGRS